MEQRTELLKAADKTGLQELEKQCLAHNEKFRDWECNEDVMRLTRKGEALYMHCLPADISGVSCRHGEVSAGVFEKYRLLTYKEAGFKPYIIAAMMLANRYRHPGVLLEKILNRNTARQII